MGGTLVRSIGIARARRDRPEEPWLQHAPPGRPERPRRRPRADVSGVATAEVPLERS